MPGCVDVGNIEHEEIEETHQARECQFRPSHTRHDAASMSMVNRDTSPERSDCDTVPRSLGPQVGVELDRAGTGRLGIETSASH